MAERAPRDRKVPSSNPALDPMRRVSKYNPESVPAQELLEWKVYLF